MLYDFIYDKVYMLNCHFLFICFYFRSMSMVYAFCFIYLCNYSMTQRIIHILFFLLPLTTFLFFFFYLRVHQAFCFLCFLLQWLNLSVLFCIKSTFHHHLHSASSPPIELEQSHVPPSSIRRFSISVLA